MTKKEASKAEESKDILTNLTEERDPELTIKEDIYPISNEEVWENAKEVLRSIRKKLGRILLLSKVVL